MTKLQIKDLKCLPEKKIFEIRYLEKTQRFDEEKSTVTRQIISYDKEAEGFNKAIDSIGEVDLLDHLDLSVCESCQGSGYQGKWHGVDYVKDGIEIIYPKCPCCISGVIIEIRQLKGWEKANIATGRNLLDS